MAEADLQTALRYTSDTQVRVSILAAMGSNRETHLNDDAGALAAYRKNYESKLRIGGAEEFRSVQGAAAILTKLGKFDEALATFGVVEFDNQTGFWRNAMLLSRGDTLAAAGRKDEALADCKAVLTDKSAEAAHRRKAEELTQALKASPEN